MKNAVFWDVESCGSCVNRRFGGPYRLHLQGRKIRERKTSLSRWLQLPANLLLVSFRLLVLLCGWICEKAATCSSWFLARGFFCPEDGGDTVLRNVGSHKIHTTPHPRRRNYSIIVFFTILFLEGKPIKYSSSEDRNINFTAFMGQLQYSFHVGHRASEEWRTRRGIGLTVASAPASRDWWTQRNLTQNGWWPGEVRTKHLLNTSLTR
jgi:hypothetical protein